MGRSSIQESTALHYRTSIDVSTCHKMVIYGSSRLQREKVQWSEGNAAIQCHLHSLTFIEGQDDQCLGL
jgi:hypothetical protein